MEPMTFDRCSPGAYAFARRQDAEKFVQENGGIVMRIEELLRAVNSPGVSSPGVNSR
jgi:nitrous oxide reductase accessory protein NosL